LKTQNAIQTMRIIQIIDSLEAGGAERMAVSYANGLVGEIAFSGLVVSRKEGPLCQQIDKRVSYLFLNKKKAVDIGAVLKLRRYVQQHKIEVVHAHSTSFFLAFLLKLSYPKLRLFWHDHYGDSEFLDQRPTVILQLLMPFFSGIIVVNQKLKNWGLQKLRARTIIYLPNFVTEEKRIATATLLHGVAGKRIVCLANLRPQKDHFLIVAVAEKLKKSHPDWTFHLVGKDFEDAYSQKIKEHIRALDLEKKVFLYGTKSDINHILNQATLAILTSQSEGLPIALLEYGNCQKAVVVTAVGEIPTIVQHGFNGYCVPAGDHLVFYHAILRLIEDSVLRDGFAAALHQTILNNYTEKIIIKTYLDWLQNKKQ
jgi:glycosyltransferase involved in cell wall biosynthesis